MTDSLTLLSDCGTLIVRPGLPMKLERRMQANQLSTQVYPIRPDPIELTRPPVLSLAPLVLVSPRCSLEQASLTALCVAARLLPVDLATPVSAPPERARAGKVSRKARPGELNSILSKHSPACKQTHVCSSESHHQASLTNKQSDSHLAQARRRHRRRAA